MRFLKDDDSVGIGPSSIVPNPPDMRGFRKLLLVNQYPRAAKPGPEAYGNNNFIKPQVSLADLTNFERYSALRPHNPVKFLKNPFHHRDPFFDRTDYRQLRLNFLVIDVIEPTS